MENGFEKISDALSSLEDQELLKYLPGFECCGTCAWYSIRNDDWGSFKYVATFNEQTKEYAIDRCQLDITVSSFSIDFTEDPVDYSTVDTAKELIKNALLSAGYELFESKEPIDYHRDLKFNTFYETEYGFCIWDRFEE